MRSSTLTVAALAAAMTLAAGTASAVTSLGTFANDYGSDAGKVDPGGTDVLGADFVTVSDQSSGRFSDSFDLSALFGTFQPGYVIDRFELTLEFDDSGPSCPFFLCGLGEIWEVRVQGSDSAVSSDDFFGTLSDPLSPQSFTVSIGTDIGSIDAFQHSVQSQLFEFWFSESSIKADAFDLNSAELEVFGTASVIPLPAGLPLVAGAFALAGLVRRYGRRDA